MRESLQENQVRWLDPKAGCYIIGTKNEESGEWSFSDREPMEGFWSDRESTPELVARAEKLLSGVEIPEPTPPLSDIRALKAISTPAASST